jgi:predicted secreted protein
MPRLFALVAVLLLPVVALGGTDPTYDRVQLDASASMDVDNDRMTATLFAQSESASAAVAASEVNDAVAWALDLLDAQTAIQVQTAAYHTSPVYRNNEVRAWRVKQAIHLSGADSSLLGELVGRLQERLKMQNVSYEVSPQRRRMHVDQLTDDALGYFSERATRIAKTLGRGGYRLVQLSIRDDGRPPVPMARGLVMAAEAAPTAPAHFDAGTQTVTVTISGEIELLD